MSDLTSEFTRNPVDFMGTHYLHIGEVPRLASPNLPAHGRIEGVGDDATLYLSAEKGMGALLTAYWLSWGENQALQLRLGKSASYLFTPSLTGCSFFVGRKWYSPLVAHVNYVGADSQIDQQRVDVAAELAFTKTPYSLKPDDYGHETGVMNPPVIVFGVRKFWGWYIYWTRQDWDPKGGNQITPPKRIN